MKLSFSDDEWVNFKFWNCFCFSPLLIVNYWKRLRSEKKDMREFSALLTGIRYQTLAEGVCVKVKFTADVSPHCLLNKFLCAETYLNSSSKLFILIMKIEKWDSSYHHTSIITWEERTYVAACVIINKSDVSFSFFLTDFLSFFSLRKRRNIGR